MVKTQGLYKIDRHIVYMRIMNWLSVGIVEYTEWILQRGKTPPPFNKFASVCKAMTGLFNRLCQIAILETM